MTNKEAIAILENLKIQGKTFFSQRLALNLAIKALEERPQGDLISRSALKEEFAKHEDRKGYLIGDWEDIIDNAPTIETSYDLYREETCERKAHCYDYKYWHCIGCRGCKADMRGGKQ